MKFPNENVLILSHIIHVNLITINHTVAVQYNIIESPVYYFFRSDRQCTCTMPYTRHSTMQCTDRSRRNDQLRVLYFDFDSIWLRSVCLSLTLTFTLARCQVYKCLIAPASRSSSHQDQVVISSSPTKKVEVKRSSASLQTVQCAEIVRLSNFGIRIYPAPQLTIRNSEF